MMEMKPLSRRNNHSASDLRHVHTLQSMTNVLPDTLTMNTLITRAPALAPVTWLRYRLMSTLCKV